MSSTLPPPFWPILLGVLGAVFGSFIATVAIRWPAGRSALGGRSGCDGCGRELAWFELVPVASFVVLRGRCRSCGAGIATGHVVTELLGAGVGIAAGLVAPGWEGVAGAACGWLLLALGAIDLAAFWLPDVLTGTLAVVALGGGLAGFAPSPSDRLIGGAAGFAALWLVAAGYRRVRGRIGLGGGDPKLFGAIGLWLGWRALPMVLLIASVAGLAVVAVMAVAGKKPAVTDRLPLGTLLAGAAFLCWAV
ncbi:prepilin peptidase [Sphingomonas hankookensis]|uniref:prepilin peptidase n=1 Tax=Sphingomonas hankookensis TaxID=563996 RepID=UPI001F5A4128|nr:A24 family peptidase [Sphingomonas hankookensis]